MQKKRLKSPIGKKELFLKYLFLYLDSNGIKWRAFWDLKRMLLLIYWEQEMQWMQDQHVLWSTNQKIVRQS